MANPIPFDQQNTPQNNIAGFSAISGGLIALADTQDTLEFWRDFYLGHEVTTRPSSRRAQELDINRLIAFCLRQTGGISRLCWTPRISKAFQEFLQSALTEKGKRQWSDRTINRILAHLKTFAKFIHRLNPFPLGSPMEKIRQQVTSNGLEIERAITPQERNRILDAADELPITGGLSQDRSRFKDKARPRRKNFRPYRNRAIVYVLTETGMRRAAVTKILLADIAWENRSIKVEEKGGLQHQYKISNEGLDAIRKYVDMERYTDDEKWQSPYFFLSSRGTSLGTGQLNEKAINTVWNQVCVDACVAGKTPHSARHAMGKHIIAKTGNVAAVQRQLGHKNAVYSMQYARITAEELDKVINDR